MCFPSDKCSSFHARKLTKVMNPSLAMKAGTDFEEFNENDDKERLDFLSSIKKKAHATTFVTKCHYSSLQIW